MSIYSLAECGHIVEIGAQCQTCLDQVPFPKAKETTHSIWMRKQEFDALKEQVAQLTADLESGFMKGAYARLQNLQSAEHERDRLAERVGKLRDALRLYASGDYSTCESIGEYSSPMDDEAGAMARQALADDDKLAGGGK